jgi:type I restriction enzyme S subunit
MSAAVALDRAVPASDSPIPWAPKIPEGWEVLRIRSLFSQRKERNDPIKTREILSLTAAQGVVPCSQKEGVGGNKPKDDLSKYDIAYPGDLLVNCMNIVAGSAGVSAYYGAISPVYYALVPRENADIKYYGYLFRLSVFQRSLIGLGKGILMHESSSGKLNTVRMRISMSALGNVKLPCPPLPEQRAIAAFLDKKCRKMDALVEAKTKAVLLLKELRERTIADAVTKGVGNGNKPECRLVKVFFRIGCGGRFLGIHGVVCSIPRSFSVAV